MTEEPWMPQRDEGPRHRTDRGANTERDPRSAPRPEEERDADVVEEASMESFPASDAPSWEPLHSGTPDDAEHDGDVHG
jgi:hypothetical protein